MLKPVVLCSVVVASVASIGYLAWFDRKRRTDPKFKRKIRRQQLAAEKQRQESETNGKREVESLLNELHETISKEKLPKTPAEFEGYFLEHLGQGEILSKQGSSKHVEAAGHFYRALRIYPDPSAILAPLQQTAPPPVFEMVVSMMSIDMKKRPDSGLDLGSIDE